MTYRPKNDSNKEKILCAVLAICAMLMIIISGIVQRFGGLYQISAIVFAVLSIELYLKYVGSDYIYEAAEDSFKIYKVTGKKSICVSSLDYDMSLTECVFSDEYNTNKDSFPKYNFNVNYCKNISPKKFYVYFFYFNEKKCMLKFEPDETFVKCINEKIRFSLENCADCDD